MSKKEHGIHGYIIMIQHVEKHPQVAEYNDNYNWEICDDISIDSGQAGIYDLSYYRNDNNTEGCQLANYIINHTHEKGNKWYAMNCSVTGLKYRSIPAGIIPNGVVSSSGYGDGCYNVYVTKQKQKIIGIKINFSDESDSEESDDIEENLRAIKEINKIYENSKKKKK
ncbi:MAG: hypothetical protein Satyrvirus50_2 [Satyrvirus sp.]|uniref:Uncharacterized protein n=1 Tax=Satyrvirus sp. TaxID=2487771 RepID=A0A3G5AF45_9VIRU|nr:MAG: hypothetical protein Satyrvirus50_2 [Satyrvirus sp.]